MYCTQCGQAYADGAVNCPNCGQPIPRFPPPEPVKNHLVSAIFVTFCCCFPFGIVALVYSAQVNSKLAAGDVAGAQVASKNAYTWVTVAFLAGLLTAGGGALFTVMNR